MSRRIRKPKKWQITTQNVYRFEREERLQAAFETIIPTKRFEVRESSDDKSKNRALRKSI